MASLSLVELWSPEFFWLQKRPCHIWLSNEKKTHQISMFTYDVVISLNFVPHWNPMLTFDNIDKLSKIRQIFPPVFFQFWQISTVCQYCQMSTLDFNEERNSGKSQHHM
jgi:hypothetical protein